MPSKSKMTIRTLTGITCAAALLTTTWFSLAQAYPMGSANSPQAHSERMHDYVKSRMDRLADRLEIKASQQAVWDEYANAVTAMTEQATQQPADEADAAAIARYRADRTAELSKKMSRIADATASLQAVLTEEQRKTFNMVARNPHGGAHGWGGWDNGKSCHGKQHGEHGWGGQHDDKSWQDSGKS